MDILDSLILFWLLPSLVTLQIYITIYRVLGDEEPKDYTSEHWVAMLIVALLYPLGIAVIIIVTLLTVLEKPCVSLIKVLCKDIKFKRN